MKIVCKKIVKKLLKKKLNLSIVESCTGGLLSSYITSIPGSSKVFNVSMITYSNKSKINILKVPKKNIEKYGSVSNQVCLSMLQNIFKLSKSSICLSITGIAGPTGGKKNKPVGLVYIGIRKGNKIKINKYQFKNKGRHYIQKMAVNESLKLILSLIK